MTIFIQLTPNPLEPERARRQREHFHSWVEQHDPRHEGRVLLVEPDAQQTPELQELWGSRSGVDVIEAVIGDDQTSTRMFRPAVTNRAWAPFTRDERALRRRFPRQRIDQETIPTVTLTSLIAKVEPRDRIALLALDAASSEALTAISTSDLGRVDGIAIDGDRELEQDPSVTTLLRQLKALGFSRAGRAWGEAGESILLLRATDPQTRIRARGGQIRSSVGRAVVTVRDRWLGPSRRAQAAQPIRVALDRDLARSDILDSKPGTSLTPPSLRSVERALTRVQQGPAIECEPARLPQDDPRALAEECFDRHGVWPISFSYPRPIWDAADDPGTLVSPITPGLPYSFDDEEAYRRAYADAYWGITHRKAGWDCFRHVEILGAGAAPWMLDARDIPRYSMIHYPKRLMVTAADAMAREGIRPSAIIRQAFHDHAEAHLTSRAMATYLLDAAGFAGATSVLFVDERLPHHADYQSMLTLIGLKQLLGRNVDVLHPVDYIYDDTAVNTSRLYGRGFGYTRAVSGDARSAAAKSGRQSPGDYDVIVVGSVTRNADVARSLLRQHPPERTVWIHGEDLPPAVEEVAAYRRSRVHMFVRAIHTSR